MKSLQMFDHNEPGLLISLCGLDGCGKTTIINLLENDLFSKNIPVERTKQPTEKVRKSEVFRSFMDTPNPSGFDYRSLSLYAASDRVQHSNKYILPLLSKGKVVISDRYFFSCLVNLRARGYENDKWIYEISKSIPKPDIAIFLDIDVETAINRVRSREIEKDRYINVDFERKLRNEYIKVAKCNNGIVIPTNKCPEETYSLIKRIVEQTLVKKGIRSKNNTNEKQMIHAHL